MDVSSELSTYRRLRRRVGRIETVRHGMALTLALKAAAGYRPERDNERYEPGFATAPDGYGYDRKPHEQGRYALAAEMIDRIRGGDQIGRVLEVGCHEGAFTQMLIPRCRTLVATDNSVAVLQRAEARLAATGDVDMRKSDLCLDPIPGAFDLIVLMDVLEVIHRPKVMRAVRDKVVAALAPGGHLLVTNSATDEYLERAWWARFLLRGGRRINDFVARHPELQVVEDHDEHLHAITLLRRVPAAANKG